MIIFTTPGRLEVDLQEEVAMSGAQVAAADEAAVLRSFDEVASGEQDHALLEGGR